MLNNLLFVLQSLVISLFAVGAIFLGSNALCTFISFCWLMGNLFVMKEVMLFGLSVVSTDVFAIGADLGLTMLREYYGKQDVKRAIIISCFSIIFFLISAQFLIWYLPTAHDISHEHFAFLFGYLPRIMLSSLAVSTTSKFIALWIGNKLNHLFNGHHLKLRTFIALASAQFIDTTLFVFCALYGEVESPFKIIAFSYAIKCLSILIMIPAVTTIHSYIRKK